MTREERQTLWAHRVAEQQASGASAAAWCASHDVALPAFYQWRRRVAASVPAPAVAPPHWLALDTAPTAGTGLMLQVGAVAITVTADFDPQVLADVVRVLTARC